MPDTKPLVWEDDIASRMIHGIDKFLLKETEEAALLRPQNWHYDFASLEAYRESVKPNRSRLAKILGLRDKRVPFSGPEVVRTMTAAEPAGRGAGFAIHAVRWPAVDGVDGEGLLLTPERPIVADVVAVPDADQTPEQLVGLTEGIAPESQYARRLAESGCRVLVPMLINRHMEKRSPPGREGGAQLTNREFLYRPSFELGRHIIGYELQKILAAVDWFSSGKADARIAVVGWGEGGLLAFYAAALDERVDTVCVSGYFDDRRNLWQEPIERNVFGLIDEFGDAELASLIVPRTLVVEAARGPEVALPSAGGAPGRLISPKLEVVEAEVERARQLVGELKVDGWIHLVKSDGRGPPGTPEALRRLLRSLVAEAELAPSGRAPRWSQEAPVDPEQRHARQMEQIERHTQWLLEESPYVRAEFMKKLDTSSLDAYQQSAKEYRRYFCEEVIGRFDDDFLPPQPRSRKVYETPRWTGYEVVLDVYPDVIAYGILLLPVDIKPEEKRPIVVCQHGLEGRPQDVLQGDHHAYHDFAAKLADRGFIVFAPQNPYIFQDRFRTLQRKANPLGKTLFTIITAQHRQILAWLKSLPNVDPQRIAFYGLSYGGKTAMRVPAILEDYCLSICSADFNDWVWKNASTRSPYSYVWTGEYEIFEFDLGRTFNYAEMAALIAPRPFMVERGHFDGVAPDERVALEFAKVRHLYQARLGIGERCQIEWFVGPHTINGKGAFDFLHRELEWPWPGEKAKTESQQKP